MPQRKQKGRSNNKKKKGYHNNGRANGPRVTPGAKTVGSDSYGEKMRGEMPANWRSKNRPGQVLKENYKTVYSRYKEATSRFINYMMENTPEEVRGSHPSTNSLCTAADWMAEQIDFCLDPSILKDLKLAIHTRKRVAASVFGGGDVGHNHFISVLNYCRSVLIHIPTSTASTTNQSIKHHSQQQKTMDNPFIVLMEGDDQHDQIDEHTFTSTPVSRPQPQPQPITLDQIMESDDRNDAILFLLTMDELMGRVSQQYKSVLQNKHEYRHLGAPDSALIEEILEGAVATNMAIQQVQQLEMELQLQHSHLTTPYRLLATLIMPEITKRLTEIMQEHAAQRCTERDIIIFLGDSLECHFRNSSDPLNRKQTIVAEFCKCWDVNQTGTAEIQQIFTAFEAMIVLEVPVGSEKTHQGNIELSKMMESLLPSKSHCWLQNMPFIGGDRSIHHTIRLLQTFGDVIRSTPEDRSIEPKRGSFGPPVWLPGRSTKIHGDLDELLLSDILPQWVIMCRKGIWGRAELPREAELCPLFVSMRRYVKNPDQPVPWSLAFAIHAMLTAILETDSIVEELITTSKTIFDDYFKKIEWAHELSRQESDSLSKIRVWNHNIYSVKFLQNLGLSVFGERAIWNPLCAGTIFSYLCFFGNLEAGCAMVDCHAQLRITLHLFNALLVNGMIQKGELPMLDIFYNSFKSSKGLWEGSLPKRGELVQRFWICFGMSVKDAKRMAEKAKQHVRRGFLTAPGRLDSRDESFWRGRKMTHIEPAEIATSFRRICNRDFHDVVDNYHTPEQRRLNKGTDHYLLAVRTNDTLDAIDNEQQILSFNLPSCGAIFEQFICSLGRVLQWEPLLASGMGTSILRNDKRQGFVVLFVQHLLGALDFADDPYDHYFLDVPLGRASSTFMNIFFTNLEPSNVVWFQATAEAKAEEETDS